MSLREIGESSAGVGYDEIMDTHERNIEPTESQTHDEAETSSPPESSSTPDSSSGSEGLVGATVSEGAKILEYDEAKKFAILAAQSLGDDKCTDVVVLDVGGISPLTGFIVIGSGTSARQMKSALVNLEEVAQECGTSTFQISEDNDAIWLLADFVDVVVHLFEPNARAHYDLEGLWDKSTLIEVPASDRSQRRAPGLPPLAGGTVDGSIGAVDGSGE